MLDLISIASSCSADWDEMPGADQVRHCSQCNQNVYNLSAMTRLEAEALLRQTEAASWMRTSGRRVSCVSDAAGALGNTLLSYRDSIR